MPAPPSDLKASNLQETSQVAHDCPSPIGALDGIDYTVSISTLKTTKIDMVAAVVYNVQLIVVGGYHSGLGLTWTNIGPNWTLFGCYKANRS